MIFYDLSLICNPSFFFLLYPLARWLIEGIQGGGPSTSHNPHQVCNSVFQALLLFYSHAGKTLLYLTKLKAISFFLSTKGILIAYLLNVRGIH